MVPTPMAQTPKRITPLKRAIFESGRTQRDIAAACGESEATFSRIVNGLRVEPEREARIAREVGLPADVLFESVHVVRAA